MKEYYHVTPLANWTHIKSEGLIPMTGDRSIEMNEPVCIFLFPSIEDMNTALSQWLGEWFEDAEEELGESIPLASLKITLPDDFPIHTSSVEFEKISFKPIPAHYITFIQEE